MRTRRAIATEAPDPVLPTPAVHTTTAPLPPPTRVREREDQHHYAHSHAHLTGPYRDEDVLLSLQLLAYLSKYPHVQQAFYKRRSRFRRVRCEIYRENLNT